MSKSNTGGTMTFTIDDIGFRFPELHDAQAVADWLYAHGIRGQRGNPCKCPVARLLRPNVYVKWPETNYIGIVAGTYDNGSQGIYGYMRVSELGIDRLVDLPEAVIHFVYHFDRGAYPHLEGE